MFKFFRRMFSGMFYWFTIGCLNDVNVSFNLAEMFDSSEPDNSKSIKLYTDSLTKSSAML